MKEEIKFKVGDRVYSPSHGYGVVTEINDDWQAYPIVVTWDEKKHGCSASIFTPEGSAFKGLNSEDDDITLVEKDSLNGEKEMGDYNNNDKLAVVGRSMPEEKEEVGQIAYSVINPAHYRVDGIPEAIEIMEHLMTKEQLEGFLWGNILKYAYRYGRKGDKKETAGKIKWYAQRLEELVQ